MIISTLKNLWIFLPLTVMEIAAVAEDPTAKNGNYTFNAATQNVRRNIENIKTDKNRIAYWKLKIERDENFNELLAANIDREELAKTESDLRKDNEYLKASWRRLKEEQKLVIHQNKMLLKDQKATIKSLGRKIRKVDDDHESAQYFASMIASGKKDITNTKIFLQNLKIISKQNEIDLRDEIKVSRDYLANAALYTSVNDATAGAEDK